MGLNHKEKFEHTTEQDRMGHTCEAFPEPKFVMLSVANDLTG